MYMIVTAPICPLYLRPEPDSPRADELLCGMTGEIVETPADAPDFVRLRTFYAYEGYAPRRFLSPAGEEGGSFLSRPRWIVSGKNACDVLEGPSFQSRVLMTLLRGAALSPLGESVSGWQQALLADGRRGFVRAGLLSPMPTAPVPDENALRRGLTAAAMEYAGTPYRWGGKTPAGIDCSGLVFMAYLLNGIIIWRDAQIRPGFPIHEIPMEQAAPGDLLFFPSHVAMYLGGGQYCHATGRAGDDGFALNSLDPGSAGYRQDLAQSLTSIGSYF